MSGLKNLRELFSVAGINRVVSIDDCYAVDADGNELQAFKDEISSWEEITCDFFPTIPDARKREELESMAAKDQKTLWLIDNDMGGNSEAGLFFISELISKSASTDAAYRNVYALTSANVGSEEIRNIRGRLLETLQGAPATDRRAYGSESTKEELKRNFLIMTDPDTSPDELSETVDHSAVLRPDKAEAENRRSLSFFACIVEKRLITGDLPAIVEAEETLCEQIIRGVLDNCSAPLLQHISDIYTSAVKKAADRILPLGTNTVNHIFFESGKNEGIMPTDMIQRFLTSILRNNVSEQIVREFDSIAEEIDAYYQAAESMRSARKDEDDYASVLEVRTTECYDRNVNGRYLPVLSGDIFQIDSGETFQYYLLLGQACNLTVRSGGERTAQCATLAEITLGAPSDKFSPSTHRLGYFWNLIPGKKRLDWRVDFNRTINIDFTALDLCSLNADGTAGASVNQEGTLDCPVRYPSSIRKRLQTTVKRNWEQLRQFQEQCKRFQRLKDAYESGVPNLSGFMDTMELDFSRIAASVREIYGDNSLNVVPSFGEGSVRYNIRRLARLSEIYTDKILREYGNYHSRKAVEFDFAESYQEITFTVEYKVDKSKDVLSVQELTTKYPYFNTELLPLSSFVFHQDTAYQKDRDKKTSIQNEFERELRNYLPDNIIIQGSTVNTNSKMITVTLQTGTKPRKEWQQSQHNSGRTERS